MNSTLVQVLTHCGQQLEKYQRCVENHPNNWNSICDQQRKELNKCSEESIPELKSLKQKCNKVIIAYENCLIKNETTPENCINELEDLYNCTESNSSSSTSTNTNTSATTTITPANTEIKS
ncbi:20217_t:CDS:2 [Entrophospora sp. SA101]|nr:4052_t:CDS:2 [Entrophospora sp. SA101]CAJ0649082.1 2203_t:CDS:2 [Entrophospora sp. SA101]CAJ0765300.1 20217_t:CDS:2 [Entrophospora sp. SA101]CAJ0823890.1 14150_t:CDS:2 [Entrophospora sp. SA101]CAJ0841162.1 4216_t:CDS:2 [Entrophospora sp. SA101]